MIPGSASARLTPHKGNGALRTPHCRQRPMGVKVLEWAHRSEQMSPVWAAQTGSLTPQRNDLGWARPEKAGRFCDCLGREVWGAPLPPRGAETPEGRASRAGEQKRKGEGSGWPRP